VRSRIATDQDENARNPSSSGPKIFSKTENILTELDRCEAVAPDVSAVAMAAA
jgi:hypothetical protein